MSLKLRAMGWKPVVQGGNGRGPTVQEQALAAALGWNMNVAIPTRIPKGHGYPTCYKVDVGNSDLKFAIEIDGDSHCALSRKAQDLKKEEFLRSRGWLVLRFSNAEIDRDLQKCVQTVLSIISK